MKKYRLMVPGPTPLPPAVLAAGVAPMEDERTPEYAAIYTRVLDNLRRALLTRSDVLLFASSVTGAFEGALQNLCSPGDPVVIANNGVFATRWVEMAAAYGLDVVEVAQPWGEPADPDRVAQAVRRSGARAAICVHCETSTGAVSDLAGFAAACGGAVSVVDAASSAGALELRTDDWGVDVVVSGGHKALMTPPGLGFVSISRRAWDLHRSARLPRYYFDWDQAYQALHSALPRAPWTPAVSLIRQLDAALALILADGMAAVFTRHVVLGRMARAGVRALGLALFSPDDDRSAAVTAARAPAGIDATAVVEDMLYRHGIQIAGAAGPLAGSVLRIGHCGYVDGFDLLATLAALALTLRAMGQPIDPGAGVAAAARVLAAAEPALAGQLDAAGRYDAAGR